MDFLNSINLPVFTFWEAVKACIEITIISSVIYFSILFLQRTRAVAILRGLGLLFLFGLASYIFQLNTIFFMLKAVGAVILIILPIVFQPELRRALDRWGRRDSGRGVSRDWKRNKSSA